ncbi:CvpA family protein [uncultured Eubacterium sp.]|uniref:CvpA family protein n=1 Tax=uncultured Eubacterium sp. TaxID=165185 RepID=UPI0026718EB4|nr:CvpA family protein [uncultured Eubacterium sp.]
MGNTLLIGIGIFVIAMILIGLKRGMIKMAFSFVSIFIILILINILTPSVKQLLKATPIYTGITTNIEKYVNDNVAEATKNMTQTGVGAQKKIIHELPLPKEVRKTLEENNNQDSYETMKVGTFAAYISTSLADMIVGALAFIILFIILSILLRVLINILDIIAKLPVISTFNAAGGALLGLAESVIIIWIGCIVVTAFSSTQWGQMICKAIAENGILSFIYDNNIIQQFITGIFTI